jgi:hypothetical protein
MAECRPKPNLSETDARIEDSVALLTDCVHTSSLIFWGWKIPFYQENLS